MIEPSIERSSDQLDGFHRLHDALTERIIRVFYRVANELGYGFVESVYRRAMLVALHDSALRLF